MNKFGFISINGKPSDSFQKKTKHIIFLVLIFFCVLTLNQTVHVLRHRWEYSCEKAKAELDYKPRSLREGLAEVLLWLKNLRLVKY